MSENALGVSERCKCCVWRSISLLSFGYFFMGYVVIWALVRTLNLPDKFGAFLILVGYMFTALLAAIMAFVSGIVANSYRTESDQ